MTEELAGEHRLSGKKGCDKTFVTAPTLIFPTSYKTDFT
ncbi:hypothetical protein CUZ96_1063 [Enterococcus lactis]|nr:hypothetical protein [Enterococcus lactis]